jgi:hypothetical protein
MREVMTQLHQKCYFGIQAMCDDILEVYMCPGIGQNRLLRVVYLEEKLTSSL